MVKDTTSDQYKLLQQANSLNGIYHIGEHVCVAMSGKIGKTGDVIKVTLSSGMVFTAILTDVKADNHVNENGEHLTDSSAIEFVVDESTLDPYIKQMGSLDSLYPGSIVKIEKWNGE